MSDAVAEPLTKSGTDAKLVFRVAFGGLVLGLVVAKLLDVLHVPKSSLAIWIAVALYVLAIVLSVVHVMSAGARLHARLEASGERGTARVVSATETGTQINRVPVVEVVLDLELPGRAPYRVRHREPLGLESAHKLVPGTSLPVLVDRSDPLLIAVSFS